MFVEDYPRSFRSLIIYNKRIKCNLVFANNFGKSSFFSRSFNTVQGILCNYFNQHIPIIVLEIS